MKPITITEVRTTLEIKAFIDFPWLVYRNAPNWVPPLKSFVKKLLDTANHPFWNFSERVLFLAHRDTEVVGRIAGIIDGNANAYHNEKACGWGFFESINDVEVAGKLYQAVEQWASRKGMSFLRGPLNPSTNYEVGMLIDGFEFAPSIMMPYNLDYYPALVEAAGFSKEKDLYALRIQDKNQISPRIRRLCARIRRKHDVRVRSVKKKHFVQELELFQAIYNESWSKNWGFVPMTKGEMELTAREMLSIIDEEMIFFIYYKDEPVGACLTVPNINPVLQRLNGRIGINGIITLLRRKKYIDSARCMALGVKTKYHNLGLPLLALDYMIKLWEAKPQYKEVEVGWNLEDNYDIIKYEEEAGCRIYKTYRVYRKNL